MYLDIRRAAYADYFDWYNGNMASLFSGIQPNNINGLSLVKAGEISTEFNYFGAVSRFFSDAMLGDLPTTDTEIADLLESLTEHWAVTGESCLVGRPGNWRAVRPDFVFPVFDTFDTDRVTKFLFVYPRRENQYETEFTYRINYATSARVIEYDVASGQATESTREYRTGYIGDNVGGQPIDIGQVIWIRTRDGVYPQMKGIVREITMRLNILQRFLNSVSNSLLQVDKDAISGGVLQNASQGNVQDRINKAVEEGLGLTVDPPFIGEEGARFVERNGQGLQESLEYLRLLLGQLGVISGVPDYVFGVQLGRPANETERVLFSAQAKVNRYRRNVETAFQIAGLPIHFGNEPFVTRSEMLGNLGKQLELGGITVNEYREQLGRNPLPSGNELPESTTLIQRFRNAFGGNN